MVTLWTSSCTLENLKFFSLSSGWTPGRSRCAPPFHPVYTRDSVQRWQKSADGKVQKVAVPRPTVVTEYNKYMGGVDTSDQMIGTHSLHLKTKRWSTSMFQRLVDIDVTDLFVIHKDQCVTMRRKQKTQQSFQEELAAHLLGVPLQHKPQKKSGEKHLPAATSRRSLREPA